MWTGRWFVCFLAAGTVAPGQGPAFQELAALFEYDRDNPGAVESKVAERRGSVTIADYSFASPVKGRVPGLLVTGETVAPRPLILFGHWMMQGSPLRNKGEFLEEAVLMAGAGAVCLLLDGPLVRPGVGTDPEPMNGQGPHAQLQMAKEWRKALDLMLDRGDVDATRVACVGHSFNAGVGAMLTGVEKRIGFFVLMANQYSLREHAFDPRNPLAIEERKKRGDEWIEAYLAKFPWADTVHFVKRSSPAAVFLQFGSKDKPIPFHIAELGFSRFGEPKRMEIYDAGHELNAEARVERVRWLAERLGLGSNGRSTVQEDVRTIPDQQYVAGVHGHRHIRAA